MHRPMKTSLKDLQFMRAPIAYYMMIVYFTVMFKPLLPIVRDVVSHTFAEAIHIATVHAIYGSNHLQKELAQTCDSNSNNKHQGPNNGQDEVQVHVSATEFICHLFPSAIGIHFQTSGLSPLENGFLAQDAPPPKFAAFHISSN